MSNKVNVTFVEQIPSREADSFSDSAEVFSLSWKPKVHFRGYNTKLSLRPIPSGLNSVHSVIHNKLKLHFNINLPSPAESHN